MFKQIATLFLLVSLSPLLIVFLPFLLFFLAMGGGDGGGKDDFGGFFK